MDEISQDMVDELEFQEILKNMCKDYSLDYEQLNKELQITKKRRSWVTKLLFRAFNKISMISLLKLSTPSIKHDDNPGSVNRVFRIKSYLGGTLSLISYVPIAWLVYNRF